MRQSEFNLKPIYFKVGWKVQTSSRRGGESFTSDITADLSECRDFQERERREKGGLNFVDPQ